MKKTIYFNAIFCVLFISLFSACSSSDIQEKQATNTPSPTTKPAPVKSTQSPAVDVAKKEEKANAKPEFKEREDFTLSPKGMYYKLHTQNEGKKAKVGDYLVIDIAYATESGHKIFEKEDLSFKFSQQLFAGAINEGLNMLSVGDSATFVIPSNKVYLKKAPSFVKNNEGIIFDVKLHDILDESAYKKQMRVRSQSLKAGDKNKN